MCQWWFKRLHCLRLSAHNAAVATWYYAAAALSVEPYRDPAAPFLNCVSLQRCLRCWMFKLPLLASASGAFRAARWLAHAQPVAAPNSPPSMRPGLQAHEHSQSISNRHDLDLARGMTSRADLPKTPHREECIAASAVLPTRCRPCAVPHKPGRQAVTGSLRCIQTERTNTAEQPQRWL